MEKSIMDMARGGIIERVDYEMSRILDNIMDPNTDAAAKRKLTITLTLQPDQNRQTISVAVQSKSTLAPTTPVVTSLFLMGDQCNGLQAVEIQDQIAGQMSIMGEETEEPPVLRVVRSV